MTGIVPSSVCSSSLARRASELLQITPQDVDWVQQAVRLIIKGTEVAQWVATSSDFFRWLTRYLTARSEIAPAAPLWQTVRVRLSSTELPIIT